MISKEGANLKSLEFLQIFRLVKSIFMMLNKQRKIQIITAMVITMAVSSLESLYLLLAMAFINYLMKPDAMIENYHILQLAYEFGLSHEHSFYFLLITFSLIVLITGIGRVVLVGITTKVANYAGMDIAVIVFKSSINQRYEDQIQNNSSEIIVALTQNISAAAGALLLSMGIFTSLTIFFFVISALIIVDIQVTLSAITVFIFAYGSIILFVKNRMINYGKDAIKSQTKIIQTIQESIGGIREIALDKTHEFFVKMYSNFYQRNIQASCGQTLIATSPRYVMEMIAFISIALAAGFLVNPKDNDASVALLTTLGIIAIGAQRLLPVMNQLYGNLSALINSKTSLLQVVGFLELHNVHNANSQFSRESITFKNEIRLINIWFQYIGREKDVLKGANLSIKKGQRIGIIGATGSGKTTLLDILMGLLTPSSGKILIDNDELNYKNIDSWQKLIAHVPQSIYLSDSTISENIAFCIEGESIDINRVKYAIEAASLVSFIESLPNGIKTKVGERGVHLSGGQKQRIAIARAIYKNASILILDESTSALDEKTESQVIDSLVGISPEITIIMVAHRLTSLSSCDEIISIENGKILKTIL